MRGIKLSVFGDSIPDKVLSLGGDGESQVATEVGANANLDKEGKPLLVDATQGGGQASGRHDGGEAADGRQEADPEEDEEEATRVARLRNRRRAGQP